MKHLLWSHEVRQWSSNRKTVYMKTIRGIWSRKMINTKHRSLYKSACVALQNSVAYNLLRNTPSQNHANPPSPRRETGQRKTKKCGNNKWYWLRSGIFVTAIAESSPSTSGTEPWECVLRLPLDTQGRVRGHACMARFSSAAPRKFSTKLRETNFGLIFSEKALF